MAKYKIDHCCGHSREVNLYGKHSGYGGRTEKRTWLAAQECPACWGAARRAAEALMPITMTIKCNGLDTDTDVDLVVEAVLTGGTINRRDDIKAMGYSWGEVRGGLLDLVSMHRPDQAWIKQVKLDDMPTLDEDVNKLNAKAINGLGPLDVEMIRRQTEKIKKEKESVQKQKEEIQKIEKPVRPACHPRAQYPGAHWNGKYYGNATRGYSYYINNEQHFLTADEYNICMAYRAVADKYDAQVAAIKALTTTKI